MTLELLSGMYAVCKLKITTGLLADAELFSLTITDKEISLVCEEKYAPEGCKAEKGFRALRIKGTLDFSLTGILAGISGALADEGISIFAVSTFDTDYILVKNDDIKTCINALEKSGYEVE